MKSLFRLSVLWILVFAVNASARDGAEGRGFSLVGAGTFSKPDLTYGGTTYDPSMKLGYGGGALVDFMVGQQGSLETGVIYSLSKFETTNSGSKYLYTMKEITVPVTGWLHLIPGLSVGAGAFYQRGPSTYTLAIDGGSPSTQTSSYSKNNYGVQGGVRLMLPAGAKVSFLVEGLYLYGLKNLDSGSNTLKTRDIFILAGARFGF